MGNVLLARILEYFNGTLFLDDNYRFCVFFILHYQSFGDYSLEEVANELKTTPESILNFLKYLGFYDYQTFVETYYKHKRINRGCHGTGDVYASAFTGALLNGINPFDAARIAANYTVRCIENTITDTTHWYGVKFETALSSLIEEIKSESK